MIVYSPFVKALTKSLLLLLTLFPIVVKADVYFIELGQVSRYTQTHIEAGDLHYKLLPTVKVVLKSGKLGTIQKLNIGDDVSMKILKLDGKYYVDTITQLPDRKKNQDSESNENIE